MANACPVCGGKLGLLNREKSADGPICAGCSNFFFSKLGIRAAKQPTAALADYWDTLESRRKTFKETDSIYDGDALFVSIDKPNRLFCIGHRSGDKGPRMIYSFDEVAGYESDAPDDLTVTETRRNQSADNGLSRRNDCVSQELQRLSRTAAGHCSGCPLLRR